MMMITRCEHVMMSCFPQMAPSSGHGVGWTQIDVFVFAFLLKPSLAKFKKHSETWGRVTNDGG